MNYENTFKAIKHKLTMLMGHAVISGATQEECQTLSEAWGILDRYSKCEIKLKSE